MDNYNIHTHSALIRECKEGNSKAQKSLYNSYSRAMYNLAYRIMKNREDAEDILQETFTECFLKLDSFRFESTFGAWLKKILVNKCINHIKKRKPQLTFMEELPDEVQAEEDEIIYNTDLIFKGIENLADGYRIILTLYLLEGYDHSEIGQILGISESTSKSQYSRAKTRLRNLITKNK